MPNFLRFVGTAAFAVGVVWAALVVVSLAAALTYAAALSLIEAVG